jgi:ATP-dependent RNA helicase RhlE
MAICALRPRVDRERNILTTFEDLQLAKPILRALGEEGYQRPTPIQAQAIPIVLSGTDLLGVAQTGTGKTAAFALPILHRLAAERRSAPAKSCRVLVLSPTRELASQIAESFRVYGRHIGLSVATVFGGVSFGPQRNALARGVDVLVATPGRLIDHMEQRTVNLGATEILVLDEADQMLDLGFVRPIRQICARLPAVRQSLFFSATMPAEIGKLAGELLRNPEKVSVAPPSTTVERVAQRVIHVEAARKRALLVELLDDEAMSRTLVFTRTKHGADRVAKHLTAASVPAGVIHGGRSQPQREKALAAFRDGETRVLVATDIAARGIDVDRVTHVINFELPNVPESYVHRIGRTARAGAEGVAISLVDAEEVSLLRDIERTTRRRIDAEDRRASPARPAAAVVPARMADPVKRADPAPKAAGAAPAQNAGGRGPGGRDGRSGNQKPEARKAEKRTTGAQPEPGQRRHGRGDGRSQRHERAAAGGDAMGISGVAFLTRRAGPGPRAAAAKAK